MSDYLTRLPRDIYTAEQVRLLDKIAIEQFDIPGFTLMQTAASISFSRLMEKWPQTRHVQVFAGSGNNAGDGYLIASLAKEQGLSTEVITLSDPDKLQGDAKLAWDWAAKRQVLMTAFAEFDFEHEKGHAHPVVVDALLGTGLDREVTGDYAKAIEFINRADRPVLAIDIPSGLSADTGACLGIAVAADATVTFIGLKRGLLTNQAGDYVGELIYHNLGVPDAVFSSESSPKPMVHRIDINSTSAMLAPRAIASHKGNHGHVLVIGGDYSFGGAVIMAAEAALRSGAGLVSVITRSSHRPALLARRPEVMVLGTEDDNANIDDLISRATAIVIGPGLGRGDWARALMQKALSAQISASKPLVIDADALHLLAEKREQGTAGKGSGIKRDNWILTPHPGEAAALLNRSIGEIQDDRYAAVRQLNEIWGGVCLLKGSGSLICTAENSRQNIFLCSEGNAGMATGGMGDVLSGIVGGLVAQGNSLRNSLCAGVCIHGEAADLSMQADGQRGMAATDLMPYIRQLVNPAWQ
ncbi:MAG: bifunctional ADP-dependent NAD(P)H-hydrate dehydratase/NAD(P)H-hydrate epimerase [SAR86 cluster bacterium]|uniref:Bifunctional NAD(P)H-hydrate repair enzyme n=1 Tax=SAR86 cluster bacterium TaxID=2030880 RepID=A0A2A4WZX3_9GAMM|nr:MAG: bifunctional ADP-dependent NAD(P)H-hydrate dehydratase/NAD(P)H-hydrate epimerase [SAR86 cluster bacterium]